LNWLQMRMHPNVTCTEWVGNFVMKHDEMDSMKGV